MANKTPHTVGGGLGTFRKEGQKAHEAKAKAERDAQQARTHRAFIQSLTK